jgi:hypothetical protein
MSNVTSWATSERSIYLRGQAAKCEYHAKLIDNAQTQAELRKLAAEYIVEAADIESKE